MDELIGRIVAGVGIEQSTAHAAVGIILAFLAHEGPADKVNSLFGRMPGAEESMQAAGGREIGSGGIMGVGMKLMGAGLAMGQIESVVREIISYAREKGGERELGAIAGRIPGLAQFI